MIVKKNYSESDWSFGWIEDGIVHMFYKSNLENMTLEIAKSTVANRIKISGNIKMPSLLTSNRPVKVEKSAKKYFENELASKYLSAVAILVSSPLAKFTANLIMNKYMPFKRTKVPFKLFLITEKDMAINWLSNYRLEKLN